MSATDIDFDSSVISTSVSSTTSIATPAVHAKKVRIQPDWWRKTLAGCVLGATLALALSGLFAWLGPGGINADNKVQVNMWLMSPLWMLIFSFSFLFRTGTRAILWLALANVIAYGLLWIAQQGWLWGV